VIPLIPDTAAAASTLDWLLALDNPSVRFFTLLDLLDLSPASTEALAARSLIMEEGLVPALLAEQHPDGHWGERSRMYTAKYHGSIWRLLLLAELGADPADQAVRAACEFILAASQETADGGFAMHEATKTGGGRATEVIPCLTGNMLYSLIRLGYLQDPRVQHGIDWICRYQRFDDGAAEAPTGPVYHRYEVCFGTHSCHMGVVKALKALAAIPAGERSAAVRSTIDRAVEYLLAHHIYRRSHDLTKVARPGWLRLGFPLMYQTDILEILDILTGLGCRDPRLQDALAVVAAKRDSGGRWNLGSTLESGRLPVEFEAKGAPSKWITLRALRVLRRADQALV